MNSTGLAKQIILKPKEHRRVLGGHPWVFSNEIRELRGSPSSGDVVELRTAQDVTLGIGFYNAHSLIAFRMLSRQPEDVDHAFFAKRIAAALALRRTIYPEAGTFRVVHGESDFLPGLVVDKYNDTLVLQTFSRGMDMRLALLCDVLENLLGPKGIVERNESGLRTLEGLESRKGVLRGVCVPTTIVEHGLRYEADLLQGQKTGFFLDQRENRLAVRTFAAGAAVLDCFCNDGGFALNAAAAGAASVTAVDISADAVRRARANARLNAFDTVACEEGDVFKVLDAYQREGRLYDVVILDPPSFSRSRKTVPAAKKGYRDLHVRTFKVLRAPGVLISSCCSHHIEPEVFLAVVDEAARKAGRLLQLLDWRGAAPDHPTLPSVPETSYLKCGIFSVL